MELIIMYLLVRRWIAEDVIDSPLFCQDNSETQCVSNRKKP